MKNKNNKLEINQASLRYYLKQVHDLEPDGLFALKEINKDKYLDVVNQIFKNSINHWMDDKGNLVTADPKNPIFEFTIWGYPGYESIDSLETLETHLRQAVLLRNRKMEEMKNFIDRESNKGKNTEIGR